MGKHRRQRKKFHQEAKNPPQLTMEEDATIMKAENNSVPILPTSADNLFHGFKIDIDSLSKNLSDDVASVKSFKSVKSELGKNRVSKKNKLKLRREMFLKKIDSLNQSKKEEQLRKKRKNTAIIGDTNPLHDALPSLESLFKSRKSIPYQNDHQTKVKGIDKSSKQKKKNLQGIAIYKQILNNKQFQKDPFHTVANHVKLAVANEKCNSSKL